MQLPVQMNFRQLKLSRPPADSRHSIRHWKPHLHSLQQLKSPGAPLRLVHPVAETPCAIFPQPPIARAGDLISWKVLLFLEFPFQF
jgi:hypothetical protein